MHKAYDEDEDEDEDDESSSSSAESSDSDYEEPEKSSSPVRIDTLSRPQNVTLKKTKSGASEASFDTQRGVSGKSRRKGHKLVASVSGQKKLTAMRAPTKPASGHVFLHQDKKGDKGGRKFNPNDSHSAHVGGLACMGTPGEHGMTVDASPAYNRKHKMGHEKQMLQYPNETWDSKATVQFEDPDDSQRLEEIEDEYGVSKARLRKRVQAYKGQNPEAVAVKSMEFQAESDKKHKVNKKYDRDLDYLVKKKWTEDDYDENDPSSGDDDVTKGHV